MEGCKCWDRVMAESVELLLAVLIALTVHGGAAQDCNETFNITHSRQRLLVNRSISHLCFRCLSDDVSHSTTAWVSGGNLIEDSTPGVEVVNGVLVLLNPMTLFMDGQSNAYEVECEHTGVQRLTDIEIVSSAFILPPTFSRASPLVVNESNDTGRIRCDDDNPSELKASFGWFGPDGRRFSSLSIQSINRSQAGEYRCVLRSTRNETLSATFTIIVQYVPNVTSEDVSLQHLDLGSPLTLSCLWTGVPFPDVTWFLNGVPVIEEGGVRIVTTGNRSELMVREATTQHGGVYTCSASNIIGSTSLNLTVLFFPEAVTGLVITSASENTISFSWRYQSDGSRPRTGVEIEVMTGGTLVRSVTKGPTETTTTITSLQPLTNYTFTVTVLSAVGRGPPIILHASTLDPTTAPMQSNVVVPVVVTVVIIVVLIVCIVAVLVVLLIRRRGFGKDANGVEVDGKIVRFETQDTYITFENGSLSDDKGAGDTVDLTTVPHRDETFDDIDIGIYIETEQKDIPLVIPEGVGSEEFIKPEVVDLKEREVVCEGKQVTLRVASTGTPSPTLTWTFDGRPVEADYATEIGRDGSLFFVCVEKKHAGRYSFKLSNPVGSVEGHVTLVVTEEEGEILEETDKTTLKSKPIKVEEFGEYVAKMHTSSNAGFIAQFQTLATGEDDHTSNVGKEPQNKPLNRFKNILPYDSHGIQLQPIEDRPECQNQYINASPIQFLLPKISNYIACQGPLPNTITDMWRLVWQEDVRVIAMVTNVEEKKKRKCECYWPESGSEERGPFRLTLVQTQTFADYVIRTVLMANTQEKTETRKITHYHFTSWPDHGVPEYAGPMLNYLRKVKTQIKQGPLLVHCSAGVGRTGTLVAIDIALMRSPEEGVVDIPSILTILRDQRMKMVQTADQYVFIHDAVLESLSCGDTQIPAKDLRNAINKLKTTDTKTGKTGYETQFQVLEQVSPRDAEVYRSVATRFQIKNRNKNFLPSDKWRCCLKRRTPDYINASFAHGYKQKKGFIIAQAPMESTIMDFWKLVSDQECGVVVMLSGLKEKEEEVCAQYWPVDGDSLEYGEFLVTTVKTHRNEGYTQRVLTVTNPKSRKLQKVIQFQMESWTPQDTSCNPNALIEVLDHMTVVQRKTGNKPVLVHGRDTVSRVGVFCSLVNAIDLCKTEGIVDVFQVVKALRIQKPGIVQTVDQYSFVFDMILIFLDSFSVYANFK